MFFWVARMAARQYPDIFSPETYSIVELIVDVVVLVGIARTIGTARSVGL
jgi:hypothetical protein